MIPCGAPSLCNARQNEPFVFKLASQQSAGFGCPMQQARGDGIDMKSCKIAAGKQSLHWPGQMARGILGSCERRIYRNEKAFAAGQTRQ
jgi:hypothetical protein